MATSPAAIAAPTAQAITLEARDTQEHIAPLAVGSWALYDFANTIYSINVVSVFFPALILQLGFRDADYAYPMSFSLRIVALMMPYLGALSDRIGKRIPWLLGFTLVCMGLHMLTPNIRRVRATR